MAAHIPALDGVRAFAVLSVMAFHAGAPGAQLGELGVDAFFALSGFLITSLLATEFRQTNRVALGYFYARRFLRLMPAYYLYALIVTLLLLVGPWPFTPDATWSREGFIVAMWAYAFNYVPLGGLWSQQALTSHLWSLSVEEQFYFVWPCLLVVALRVGRALPATVLVACAMIAYRVFVSGGSGHLLLYDRGVSLVIGSAVALLIHERAEVRAALAGPRTSTAIVLFNLAVAVCCVALGKHAVFGSFLPVVALAISLFVGVLWVRHEGPLARALSLRPLAYIGKISYGVYLYHMIAHVLVWHVLLVGIEDWPRYPKFALRLAAFIAITVGLASLSHTLYERPFLRLKDRFR